MEPTSERPGKPRRRVTTVVWRESPSNPVIREQAVLRGSAFRDLGFDSKVLIVGVAGEEQRDKRAPDDDDAIEQRTPWGGMAGLVREMSRAAREADTLVCRGAPATAAALLARRRRSTPRIVFDARGWHLAELLDRKADGLLKRALKGAVERWAMRRADLVAAPSQALLGVAAAAGAAADRLVLIPQLPPPVEPRGPADRGIDVVYVGTSRSPYQPHETIGELLAGIAEEMPAATIEWWDGDAGPDPEPIRPNLTRRRLAPAEVPARLTRARVGLVIREPSLANLAAAPTKAMQYRAAGCQVVSGSSPPAVAEWVLQTGGRLVRDPASARSWARAITEALERPPAIPPDREAILALWRDVLG